MKKLLFALTANTLDRVMVKDVLVDQHFAVEADAIRSIFEPVERMPELIQMRIALKCKQCIKVVCGKFSV